MHFNQGAISIVLSSVSYLPKLEFSQDAHVLRREYKRAQQKFVLASQNRLF